ncbi:MAG TPA: hypothetical protein PKH39_11520, partial [Woeseiaceae bacterium]|nr:hypothetical protein [Woeseiaceae bacterium]
MPLDQFKTQVLLLHSEQSTLDSLSSGFSDNYTVHCATSGSEALNTLVETPINVIVTAQDLPGMSGLDALREAKKRSPETIGILLAGNSVRDVQALVGEEEVFQVVTGSVTSEGLSKLVDNATRQMRLMALAGAANDTVASVDEPAEHIVMETSENGSTIISASTTGRMPALDPKKISAAANVGSRSVDILVLTKDQEFLETVKDSSRGMHKVFYANTLAQANDAIAKHKIGVAVVDAAMVGEKIEQLTQHLRKGSPRLVSIVAGRRDDGEMLMDLINRGKVYRFLLKPVSPGRARLAVEASVKHHLEAPDAAFKITGSPAGQPAIKPPPPAAPAGKTPQKPAATVAQKPAEKPVAVQKPKPEPAKAAPVPKTQEMPQRAVPVDPPLGVAVDENSLINDGLADAFGQDDGSFTETVTGLISSVGEKFSSRGQAKDKPVTDPVPDDLSGIDSDGSGGSLFQNPKVLGIAAGALVVVAAIGFWALGGSNDSALPVEENLATPRFQEADVVFEEQLLSPEVDVSALLEEARLARDAGQVFNPVGSNAIELFASALQSDPDNAAIATELDAAIGSALGMAETAMLESRLDDADAALRRVASVQPQNARLPFLTSQLSQMQLRGRLDEARAAIREDRFEDAANSLSAARNIAGVDTSEIEAVAAELGNARSQQQVDDVLAKANARLDSGALISPANDNARYYYQLVLSNDPENTAARQGLSVVASKLVFQARTEMDNGRLNEAEDILASARSVDPNNSEVAASLTALDNARAAIAERERRAEAERQAQLRREAAAAEAERVAEAERIAEAERQAEADRLNAQAAATQSEPAADDAVPQNTGLAAANEAPSDNLADTAASEAVPVQQIVDTSRTGLSG